MNTKILAGFVKAGDRLKLNGNLEFLEKPKKIPFLLTSPMKDTEIVLFQRIEGSKL